MQIYENQWISMKIAENLWNTIKVLVRTVSHHGCGIHQVWRWLGELDKGVRTKGVEVVKSSRPHTPIFFVGLWPPPR